MSSSIMQAVSSKPDSAQGDACVLGTAVLDGKTHRLRWTCRDFASLPEFRSLRDPNGDGLGGCSLAHLLCERRGGEHALLAAARAASGGRAMEYRGALAAHAPPRRCLITPMPATGGGTDLLLQVFGADDPDRCARVEELTDLVENGPFPMHRVGAGGVILWANQAELDLFGYNRDEYVGRHIGDFHADKPVIDDLLDRLSRGEALCRYEARLRCKDGSIRHVAISSNVHQRDGRYVHARCFTQDITNRKLASAALRDSESKVQAILDHTEACIFAKDLHGRYLIVNRRLVEMFGWADSQQPLGKTDDELFMPAMAAAFKANDRQVIETDRPMEFEELVETDGQVRIFLVLKFPLRDHAGATYAVCGIATDISDRKQTETRLRESERRFRLMADAAPVLIWVSDAKKQGVYFNQSWLNFTGRRLEQERGEGWLDGIHADDRARVAATCHGAFDRREPFRMEFRLRRRDGAYRWVLDTGVPRLTEEGELAGYIGSCVDVTEQREAAEAVAESEQRFRNLADAAPVLIWMSGADKQYTYFNKGWLDFTGRTMAQEIGDGWAQGVYGDDLGRCVATYTEMFDRREPFRMEYRLRRADGDYRWILDEGAPRWTPDGNFAGYIGACIDITDRKRAEQALADSQRQLRYTLEAAHVGTWDWDIAAGPVRWSDNLEAIHHMAPGTFDGTFECFLRDIHPDDRPRVEAAIDRALNGAGDYHVEYRVAASLRLPCWVEGKGQVVFGEDGRPVRMSGVCADVTDRKRAEQKLAVLAETGAVLAGSLEYRQTLTQVANVAVPALADWCAIDVLDEAGELQSVAVHHGEPARLELARRLRRRYPPDPDAPRGAYHAMRTGRPQVYEQISEELLAEAAVDDEHRRLLRELNLRSALIVPLIARGRTLGAITFVSDQAQRVYTEGDLPFFQDFARNCAQAIDAARLYGGAQAEIARRAHSEAALRESETRHRAVVETAVDGIITINERGIIESVNDAATRLFGYDRQELLGRNVNILMPAPDAHQHDGYLRRYLETGDAKIIGKAREVSGKRKDGSRFPMYLAIGEFELGGRRLFTGIVHDLTIRKRIEDALLVANRELQGRNEEMAEFLYTASHDLKSPLVTTMSFIGLMKEAVADGRLGELPDAMRHIERATSHMNELINDLLQLSRVGRVSLKVEPVDATALVQELIKSMAPRLKEAGATVHVGDLPPVRADAARLTQVFENLLGNAVKYGGRPDLHIEAGGHETIEDVRLFVRDNGVGIQPQYHQRIFGLFQRIDTTREGTGVGLAIVARVAQSHGGRAWVESQPGQGATFWFALPRPHPLFLERPGAGAAKTRDEVHES